MNADNSYICQLEQAEPPATKEDQWTLANNMGFAYHDAMVN